MANSVIVAGVTTGCLLMALSMISQVSIAFNVRNLIEHEHFSVSIGNWLFIIIGIGSILGSILFSFLADQIGRKHSMTAISVLFLLSFFFTEFNFHYIALFIGKFIGGLCIGGSYVVVPVYIGEVAEKTSRGKLIALVYPSFAIASFFVTIGMNIFQFLGGYGSASVINFVSGAIAILATILSGTTVEESPFYYLKIGRQLAAKSSLVKLRSEHANHQMEFNEIQEKFQPNIPDIEVGGKVSSLIKYSWTKPLILIVAIYVLRALSGVSSLSFFMIDILHSIRLDFNAINIIFGGVHLVSAFAILFIVDKYGRKLPLLVSVVGTSVIFVFLYILVLLERYHVVRSPYLVLAGALLAYVVVDLGLGPIPFVLSGEIFPLRNKMACVGISMVCHFALTLIVPNLMLMINYTDAGPFVNIVLSVIVGVALFVIIQHFYLETKDKSLNEIQADLNKSSIPSVNSPTLIE